MHGYVLGRNSVLEDLQKLNWLPVTKRRDLALLQTKPSSSEQIPLEVTFMSELVLY